MPANFNTSWHINFEYLIHTYWPGLLVFIVRLQLWLAHEISNQQRALNSKNIQQGKIGSTRIKSAGFSHRSSTAAGVGVLTDTPTSIDEALYMQVCVPLVWELKPLCGLCAGRKWCLSRPHTTILSPQSCMLCFISTGHQLLRSILIFVHVMPWLYALTGHRCSKRFVDCLTNANYCTCKKDINDLTPNLLLFLRTECYLPELMLCPAGL